MLQEHQKNKLWITLWIILGTDRFLTLRFVFLDIPANLPIQSNLLISFTEIGL